MVLKVEEYAKQKQEENIYEAQEAKKWGMSVDEYREQIEMMKKAEDEREKELDKAWRYVHEDETGGLRDLQHSVQPIMGIDERIGQCFISRDEEQEREEHKQVEYD